MTTTRELNGNVYEFINDSFSNSRNWGHKSRLYKNNQLVTDAKAIYLNRTWESYQYQSVMKSTVYNAIEAEMADILFKYKNDNGISRLKQEKKDELFSNSDIIIELKQLLKLI